MDESAGGNKKPALKNLLLDWLPVAFILCCWCFALSYVDPLIHQNNRSNSFPIFLSPLMVLLACSSLMLVFQKRNRGYLTYLQCLIFAAFFGLLTTYTETFARNSVTVFVAASLLSGVLAFDEDLQSPASWLQSIKSRQFKLLAILGLVAFVYLLDWIYYPHIPRHQPRPPHLVKAFYYAAIAIGFYQGPVFFSKHIPAVFRYGLLVASIACATMVLFVDFMIDLSNIKDDSIPQSLELGIAFLACLYPIGFALGKLLNAERANQLENDPVHSEVKPLGKSCMLILFLLPTLIVLGLTMLQSSVLDPLFRIQIKKLGINLSAISCWAVALSLCVSGTLLAVTLRDKIIIWALVALGSVGSISYLVQPQSMYQLPGLIRHGFLLVLPLTLTLWLLKNCCGWTITNPANKTSIEKLSSVMLTCCSAVCIIACIYIRRITGDSSYSIDPRTVIGSSSLALVFCILFVPSTLIIAMMIPRILTYAFFGVGLTLFVNVCFLAIYTLPSLSGDNNHVFALLQIASWPVQAMTPPLLVASILGSYGFKFLAGKSPITSTSVEAESESLVPNPINLS